MLCIYSCTLMRSLTSKRDLTLCLLAPRADQSANPQQRVSDARAETRTFA